MVLADMGLAQKKDYDSIDNALREKERYYDQHSTR